MSSLMDMGFSRERIDEALRRVPTNPTNTTNTTNPSDYTNTLAIWMVENPTGVSEASRLNSIVQNNTRRRTNHQPNIRSMFSTGMNSMRPPPAPDSNIGQMFHASSIQDIVSRAQQSLSSTPSHDDDDDDDDEGDINDLLPEEPIITLPGESSISSGSSLGSTATFPQQSASDISSNSGSNSGSDTFSMLSLSTTGFGRMMSINSGPSTTTSGADTGLPTLEDVTPTPPHSILSQIQMMSLSRSVTQVDNIEQRVSQRRRR